MSDTILYIVLHDRARDVPCAKGPVRAVEHKGAGYSAHFFEGHGLVNPDYDAPEPRKPAHVTLRSTRGKTLATIYLQPYRFSA